MTTLRRLLLREQVLPVVAALVLGAGFVWMELSRKSRVVLVRDAAAVGEGRRGGRQAEAGKPACIMPPA